MTKFVLGVLLTLLLLPSSAWAASDDGFFVAFDYLSQEFWYVSNGWTNGDYQACEWRADHLKIIDDHLEMQLGEPGGKTRNLGCSELHTNSRLGYGTYEVRMRTAAGQGLNTAFFTYVKDPEWDEIDFEFLGKDTHAVQLNYYVNGKGQHEFMAPLGFDASADFHNYGFEWTANKIRWYVDGKLVHETPDGAEIPHNPSNLFLSLWAGGHQMDGWLGALNYTGPIKADVEWVGYTPVGKKCQFSQSLTCK